MRVVNRHLSLDFTQILHCLLEIIRVLNYMISYEKRYDKASVDQIVNPC